MYPEKQPPQDKAVVRANANTVSPATESSNDSLLLEASTAEDESDQETTNGANHGTKKATKKATQSSRAKKSKQKGHNAVFKDELAQQLKQLDHNDNMADLAPAPSSVGRSA